MTADCKEGGIDIWDTKHGYRTAVVNAVIVGRSYGNPGVDADYKKAAGIKTSRDDNLILSNVTFHNFG